jgi:hypothetical protein
MTTPVRIQLRRTKGWRMPPNTVKVDRSTKWGNPYKVPAPGCEAEIVALFRRYTAPTLPIEDLRGKNLACWCPLDQPCHADVLLEMANREAVPPGVYYSREHGNFYSIADHHGMGMAFWTTWRNRCEDFPGDPRLSRGNIDRIER